MVKRLGMGWLAGAITVSLGVVGAAFAYISTTVSGLDVASSYQVSEEDRELVLELADPAHVGSPDLFSPAGIVLEVVATNNAGADRSLRSGEITPVLIMPSGCPRGSFKTSNSNLMEDAVPAHNSSPQLVGTFRLKFMPLGFDQGACVGSEITFTWLPTPP